jgi:hypothetical protein
MTLEPIHGMVYFSPHGAPIYESIGLTGRLPYFASRGGALGRASAELIASTFFNFSPTLVASCIPSAWESASPEDVVAARMRVVDASLRDAAPDHVGSDATKAASELARRAALVACERVDGKPLFAAHAALAWPTEPHLVLWHAQTLLREYRGDIHIALLVSEGLTGLDALVTHGATGMVPADLLQSLRGWTDAEWGAAVDSLRERGIVNPDALTLTEQGLALRQHLEDRTDALSANAWATLGDDGCKTLRASARPMAVAVVEAGWSPLRKLPPADE